MVGGGSGTARMVGTSGFTSVQQRKVCNTKIFPTMITCISIHCLFHREKHKLLKRQLPM